MKTKLLITITLTLLNLSAFAQTVNIPDANFKAYLVGNNGINTNGDTEIQVSEAAAFTGTINCGNQNISDLTGIEAFTSVTKLLCSFNAITTINLSQNTALTEINLLNNNLSSLDLTQNIALESLNCGNNPLLATIDISQNIALTLLQVNNNNLSSLDVSQNTALNRLICPDNNLTSLDVSQNPDLYLLSVSNNPNLTSLDTSQNPDLGVLSAFNTGISSLDMSSNTSLVNFSCGDNPNLTSLNLKNLNSATLFAFSATNNPNLTCIDVDDVADATANWTNIDPGASYSLNCSPLSVDEEAINNSLVIYPNPVNTELTLDFDGAIKTVKIIDATGKTVKNSSVENSALDVSGLPKGIYFLQVFTSEGLASKKFIKN